MFEGALETCSRVNRTYLRQFLSTDPGLGMVHTRLADTRVAVGYELIWDRVLPATEQLVQAHWNAHPNSFPFSPPREGRTIQCVWADGRKPVAQPSGSTRTLSVRIRELLASD